MKFEFPDEDIMMVNNYEEFRPYDGPEQGSQWTLFFDGASNALGNGICVVLISSDRKSTRLNSSHANISYAVFCQINLNHINFMVIIPLTCNLDGSIVQQQLNTFPHNITSSGVLTEN